jgi:heat shock protein HslJ
MMKKSLKFTPWLVALALILSACGANNLPTITVPPVDRQARDFGDFSGVTFNYNGILSFDKISAGQPTGGGNVWPLFNIDLQNDRLVIHLQDGRLVFNIGDIRTALTYPEMQVAIKFLGGKNLTAPLDQTTLYVAPNLVYCVGVAPQQCMQVRQNPEDPWKLFYDQIEGFNYEEGYLYELKVAQETIANPPADSSSIRLKLVEIISQTPVSASLTETNWILETLAGERPVSNSEVTAIFGADGNLYGSAGCNSYTTRYQVGGNTITIQPPVTTRMACPQLGVSEQETSYLAALEKAQSFAIVGYRLSLIDDEGNTLITYLARQP